MIQIRDITSRILRLPAMCWQLFLVTGERKPRFPNVPDRLNAVVRDHMIEFEKTGDRNLLYLEAAGYVILEYLQIRCFDEGAHSFWGARQVDDKGNLWYGFPLRVILGGETLFMLRNCSGFQEICFRLKQRDLRSSYYEMLAAKIFARAGFDIRMRLERRPGETKKRGEEFDFTATRGRTILAAEVTALEEKEFNERTAINALNNKRTQLPNDKPTVFFCVLPPAWGNSGIDLNDWTANVANEFFQSGSRRINRVVFYIEQHVDGPTPTLGGGFITIARSFDHPNPYFPFNFDRIFDVRGDSERMSLLMEDSFENSESQQALLKLTRTGEFYEWVDSFHDE